MGFGNEYVAWIDIKKRQDTMKNSIVLVVQLWHNETKILNFVSSTAYLYHSIEIKSNLIDFENLCQINLKV